MPKAVKDGFVEQDAFSDFGAEKEPQLTQQHRQDFPLMGGANKPLHQPHQQTQLVALAEQLLQGVLGRLPFLCQFLQAFPLGRCHRHLAEQ